MSIFLADDDISTGALILLQKKDIETLIPKKGPRLVFESKLEDFKQVQVSEPLILCQIR